MYKYWTYSEERKLKMLYKISQMSDLIQIFGRSERSILVKANRLGIIRDKTTGKLIKPLNWFISVKEYSLQTGTPKPRIYKDIKKGLIKSVRIGNFYYVKP